MNKTTRRVLWTTIAVMFAGLLLLSGCSFAVGSQEALPTLYVIPTLTPSVTPSLTLFVSPTVVPSLTPTITATPLGPTSTPVIQPTSTPITSAPTQVSAAPSSLNIQYFVPTPTTVNPGGSVTLAWASSGATQATVFRVNTDGSFGQSWQVDPTGTLTVSASNSGNSEKFVLRVGDGINVKESEATLSIVGSGSTSSGSCSQSWFFSQSRPSSCPTSEVSTLAAEQEFEDGWAYWMNTTDKVYILYEDGNSPAWEVYNDTWTTSDPETDSSLTPPNANLEQPARGIGKVWRNNSTVKNRLGWAIDNEFGYTADFQQDSGGDPQNIFFSDPGDVLVRLESDGSTWRFGESLP